ncbi:MAG: hypothetical protein JST00_20455 [Deltaproteobacteria bacterium]|nr:hypothetical protein [Deltaproteobacteria bacterium]
MRRHRKLVIALGGVLGLACAIALPDRDASAQGADAGVGDAGPDAAREGGGAISRTPPDPPPMSEREQWVFDLRWDRGDVYLVSIQKIDMGTPHVTPRVMGRFALELFEGPTLIERVRFDFPMLGAPEASDGGLQGKPKFEPKLKTRIGVLFPATKRGTKLELWDRAKDQRWPLPWPPTERTYSSDGGASP